MRLYDMCCVCERITGLLMKASTTAMKLLTDLDQPRLSRLLAAAIYTDRRPTNTPSPPNGSNHVASVQDGRLPRHSVRMLRLFILPVQSRRLRLCS